MNKYLIAILGIAGLCALVFIAAYNANLSLEEIPQTESESVGQVVLPIAPLPFGTTTLTVGEKADFGAVTIRPLSIEEESRCPSDVQCIQAGTVRVKTEIVSGLGTSTDIIALGDFITTEAEKVTFVSARPEPVAGAHIPASAYRLTFEVVKREPFVPEAMPVPAPPAGVKTGLCYVGGCSSQLCSDTPGMASTCEYREEYACYQTASCERQTDGECGWTQTDELLACLRSDS